MPVLHTIDGASYVTVDFNSYASYGGGIDTDYDTAYADGELNTGKEPMTDPTQEPTDEPVEEPTEELMQEPTEGEPPAVDLSSCVQIMQVCCV
jgi:hypothetical protein